jgi:dipeptidase D
MPDPAEDTELRQASEKCPVFDWFGFVSAYRRPSGNEAEIIAAISDCVAKWGLDHETDDYGNLLVRKPASAGSAQGLTTILQAHVDMVSVSDSPGFRPDVDAIHPVIKDGWLLARGTSLGADNGLGVAAMLSVLASQDISHGPIEALFTVEEETGLHGAKALPPNWLRGSRLINLDSEDDREIINGSSGGLPGIVCHDLSAAVQTLPEDQGVELIEVRLEGLAGGHSGLDIDKGRPNAIIELARILADTWPRRKTRLVSLEGGTGRNAIPVAARAVIATPSGERWAADTVLLSNKVAHLGADAALTVQSMARTKPILSLNPDTTISLLDTIIGHPFGVLEIAPDKRPNTSINLGRISFDNGQLSAEILGRMVLPEGIAVLREAIQRAWQALGASAELSPPHPAWSPRQTSPLLDHTKDAYEALFGRSPDVTTIHAGLECATILAKYPDLDTISIGPRIENAHTTRERAECASIQRFWDLLVEILSR